MEIKSNSGLKINHMTEKGYFSGFASVFNHLDDQNDVVLPGSFKGSLEQWERQGQWPKMLWQHNQKEPIGRWLFMEETEKGLYVEGQLLLNVQKASEAYALMRAGAVDGLSIGFRVVKAQREAKSNLRYISEVDLLEISVVTFAANSQAKITRVKEIEQ
jgi:uncharacterized protein